MSLQSEFQRIIEQKQVIKLLAPSLGFRCLLYSMILKVHPRINHLWKQSSLDKKVGPYL